jgi:predicted Rossmann fold flavoprotein
MSDVDVVVVGGGPAGILAAGKAASDGASVLLLEKMEKPARKLRITGKGRCNITNTKPYNEFINDIFPDPRFIRDAFNAFFNQDIVQLLNEQGVATVEERGMRIFPTSGKAWDVAEALVKWAKINGAKIVNHARVIDVLTAEDAIVAVSYADKEGNPNVIGCKSVILATGGKSYPATGSTGEGYELASKLKHTITPLLPSLVGVETKPCYKFSRNLSLRNVNLAVYIEGKKTDEEFGEMEITPYGFNGPIVLRLSRKIVFALAKGSRVELELDLKPALSHDKLDARILREIDENPRIAVADLASRLLPRDLALEMIDELGLAAQKNLGRLNAEERESIRHWIKEQRFVVTNQRSWPEAIITAGGISLKEVNQKTMGSKKVKGLYFAGELLDLDGSTGGYNLQIAYSTGWIAGKSAAEYVSPK